MHPLPAPTTRFVVEQVAQQWVIEPVVLTVVVEEVVDGFRLLEQGIELPSTDGLEIHEQPAVAEERRPGEEVPAPVADACEPMAQFGVEPQGQWQYVTHEADDFAAAAESDAFHVVQPAIERRDQQWVAVGRRGDRR